MSVAPLLRLSGGLAAHVLLLPGVKACALDRRLGGPCAHDKKKVTFSISIFTKVYFSSLNFKTRQITPLTFQTIYFTSIKWFRRRFCYNEWCFVTVTMVLFFSLLIISAEFLKNYSKS